MLTRDAFGFIAECDSCSETLDTNEDDFHDALRVMKNDGWKIRKQGNDWQHVCPSCIEDEQSCTNDFEVDK